MRVGYPDTVNPSTDLPSRSTMLNRLRPQLRLKAPFLIAGFASFVFSVILYFGLDEKTAGIFVGLWVPSIHSLGALLLSNTPATADVRWESTREVRS